MLATLTVGSTLLSILAIAIALAFVSLPPSCAAAGWSTVGSPCRRVIIGGSFTRIASTARALRCGLQRLVRSAASLIAPRRAEALDRLRDPVRQMAQDMCR